MRKNTMYLCSCVPALLDGRDYRGWRGGVSPIHAQSLNYAGD